MYLSGPISGPFGGPEPNATPGTTGLPLVFGPDTGPETFGLDISSQPDLDPAFPLVEGFRALGEALARRLETPRGGLFYAPDYGTDIRGYLNEGLGDSAAFAIQNAVETECEKDARVQTADALVTVDAATGTLAISVKIGTAAGPFQLVLSASDAVVVLLSVQ